MSRWTNVKRLYITRRLTVYIQSILIRVVSSYFISLNDIGKEPITVYFKVIVIIISDNL